MSGHAIAAVNELEAALDEIERRRRPRVQIDGMTIVSTRNREMKATLRNISAGGALIGPLFDVEVGYRCQVELPGYGAIKGVVCRITSDNDVAICFTPEPGFHDFCADSEKLQAGALQSRASFTRTEQPHA